MDSQYLGYVYMIERVGGMHMTVAHQKYNNYNGADRTYAQ